MDTNTVSRRNGGGFTIYDGGDVEQPSKTCSTCGETFYGDEIKDNFRYRRNSTDNLRKQCKSCQNGQQRVRRDATNPREKKPHKSQISGVNVERIIREEIRKRLMELGL